MKNATMMPRLTKFMFVVGFLLTTIMSYANNLAYAQNQTFTFHLKNVSIKTVLQTIEKQSEFIFMYRSDLLDTSKKVSIDADRQSVSQILDQVLEGTSVTYEIKDRQIVLKKVEKEFISPEQTKKEKVTGKVTDQNGDPIVGATVKEINTSNGTITDLNGIFVFEVFTGKPIEVSYIGYKSQQLNVKVGEPLTVVMREDAKILDEVVVVGYGTQKKVNLTGAVSSVSASDIENRVQSDVLSAVQGTVPGVMVISRPGNNPEINFRGRGNLGTSEPLYVIDGAIADATFFSNLDPNTIESISFLKDAASSAIYGSRAAYGVVLVKTKDGKKEKMNVSYSGYVGVKMPTYLPDVLDSYEYAELLNEAMYNNNPLGSKNQAYTDEEIQKFRNGTDPDFYPNTNWVDLVLDKQVLTTQHSLNFSGGSEKVRYFAGIGYLFNDDFVPGVSDDRYNFNVNVQSDLTNWLTLRTDVKYIRNSSDTENGVPWFGDFVRVPSIMVAKQSNGEWGSIAGGKTATQTFINNNPLRALSYNDWSHSITENSMYNLGFDLKPVKGLIISGQLDYKRYEYKNKSYTANHEAVKDFQTGVDIPGTENTSPNSMSMHWISTDNLMTTLTAKYDLNINQHILSLLGGSSFEHYNYQRLYQQRTDFPIDGLEDIEVGNEISKSVPDGSSIVESKMLSYFARINYSFMDRYLFEANFRSDASSQFHANHRWGVFPSFSVGWRMSEEDFLKSITWIDNLKIRGSYGTLGNINNVGYYDYFQLMSVGADYNFVDTAVKGILEAQIANESLTWETVALTDIGLDADLFNNKLSFTADYYIKNTKDILLGYNVSRETGIWTTPSMNLAKVRNKGFEFSITHRNTIGDFSYAIMANFATNKNKIIDMGDSDNMIQDGGDNIRYILKEGEAVGSYFGLKTDGLYTQEEIDNGEFYVYGRKPNAGDIKYVTQRKDVKQYKDLTEEQKVNNDWGEASITDDDRTIIGKDVPTLTYGVNLNLQYKNFEFTVFGQGTGGTDVAFESEQVFAFMENSNPRKFHLKRWQEANPNSFAPVPRLYGATSNDEYNKHFSDYELFDADYFRIKSMSLGYMIPHNIISKWGLSSLKVFLTGENLFTIRADKEMKDFDPESPSGRGLSAYGTKSVAFGINLSF